MKHGSPEGAILFFKEVMILGPPSATVSYLSSCGRWTEDGVVMEKQNTYRRGKRVFLRIKLSRKQ